MTIEKRPNEIIVEIDSNGNIVIEAVNYSGTDCLAASAALEEGLGKVEERHFKPEYHNRQLKQQEQLRQH